jgi:hypothetical protein
MRFISLLQIKKKNPMKTMNQDYVVFYGVFDKSTESAWRLTNISLDEGLKEVQINSAYFPKSKLDFSVHNKAKKIVRCGVPEWLWIAKMEEASQFNPPSESAFDQFEKMFATEARKQEVVKQTDRLANEGETWNVGLRSHFPCSSLTL